MNAWTINQSRTLYNIERWGSPYFDINDKGHVTVSPDGSQNRQIDLYDLSQEITAMGLGLPVLLRITDILQDRIKTLYLAFKQAKEKYAYKGNYQVVYPIKVNQQRTVVEHILEHPDFDTGFEAGSKSELMILLSHAKQNSGPIICNGYKDREYIRLALIGKEMGHQVIIVIEKQPELTLILQEAKEMQITPELGLRIKLASIGQGKWQNSGGEKSKFGLSASQVLSIIDTLNQHNARDFLTLIHCHLGSQLANIRDIQTGLQEISRYYAELHRLNIPIRTIDVGGGLGVDYEGSRSRNFCSTNYSIEEYANDIVQSFQQICTECDLPHPNIITESGRALTAHHAVLICNVIDNEPIQHNQKALRTPTSEDPRILHNLWQTYHDISDRSVIEAYHDASYWLLEARSMYTHGVLNLNQRAMAEQLYCKICIKIQSLLSSQHRAHREIMDELNEKLADKYFCNLSIFQSLPDIWAIDQIFPITPLHRLDEEPTKRVTLQDLTCDSDGTIKYYVERESIETTLPAHELRSGEAYILGIFLVGAYQEILGDMHNLFGDTHSIDVELDHYNNWKLVDAEPGDTVEEILSFIHYDSEKLLQNYKRKLQKLAIDEKQKTNYLTELNNCLKGYSYLEITNQPTYKR